MFVFMRDQNAQLQKGSSPPERLPEWEPAHIKMTLFALQCSTDVNKELWENVYSVGVCVYECVCVFCKR